ncbi:MAG: hypothetical protein U1A78_33625 [Polyangia bacterium]
MTERTEKQPEPARGSEEPLFDIALETEQFGYDIDEEDRCPGSEMATEFDEDGFAECGDCHKEWGNLSVSSGWALLPIHRKSPW